MSRNSVIDDAMLLEYLDGALDANAHAAVDAALAESPELSERLQSLRALLPAVRAALDDAAAPVPPAPSWAAIRHGASARRARLAGTSSAPDAPLAVMVQARDLMLLLAGTLALAIISLAAFLMDSVTAIIVVGLTTLLMLGLLRAFKPLRSQHARPLVTDAPPPTLLPASAKVLDVGWRRPVVAVTAVDSETIAVKVGRRGMMIFVSVPAKRMSSALTVVRALAAMVQLGATVLHLMRILGFW